MNDTMTRETPFYGHKPTYQISLTYIKRKNGMVVQTSLIFYLYLTFRVKGQCQMKAMMARDTSSYSHTFIYQISLTYLERKKVMTQTSVAHYLCVFHD